MSSKQTRFQEQWLQNPEFAEWLEKVDNHLNEARCSLCRSVFVLGNMGKRALRSHQEGKKHKLAVLNAKSSASLKCFYKSTTSSIITSESHEPPITLTPSNDNPPSVPSSTDISKLSVEITPRGLQSFVLKNSISDAEILSCLQYVMTPNLSMRSMENIVKLDARKYPDSEIAKKVKLSREKISYSVNYGLAPHFHKEVQNLLLCVDCFVVCFDESFNKIAEKTQMDLAVRFWDTTCDLVATRYFNSVFLGSQTSADLVAGIHKGLSPLPMTNIIQLSMDGPNVNLKASRDLRSSVSTDPDDPSILNMGTCGLHHVNNAFERAFSENEWELELYLRASYKVLDNSPARRALYTSFSGSNIFPKPFCLVRWLENGDAADRAVKILPNMLKFVEGLRENKKEPKSFYYKMLKKCLSDPLLSVKLAFFSFIAKQTEPFLREFQGNEPLAPFLYQELNSLVHDLLERIVKPEVLSEHAQNVSKINLSDENTLLYAKNVVLDECTKEAFRKLSSRPKTSEILLFRNEYRVTIKKFCNLLLEKSPLKYPLTLQLSSLNPEIAITSLGTERFRSLISTFVQNNWVSAVTGEKAIKDYKNLFSCPVVKEKCLAYSRFKERLDAFFMDLFNLKKNMHVALTKVVKASLIFSHGNAFVESGFSINKELLETNLKEESLIARRIIHDKVQSMNGLATFVIDKNLTHAFRNAHANFTEAKRKREISETDSEVRKRKRLLAQNQVKDLEAARKALKNETQLKDSILVEKIKELKASKEQF
ncbi:uncharacterized protein [Bemisia tabaci]|uniref:uncharacterized protein n=1 Tax=Bemisia tabaci TaxID=7038 RepID=UPI003B28BC37